MGSRKDLVYEKRETKTPYIITEASDIDEALEIAMHAIYDAQSFRDYSKATGVNPVAAKEEPGWTSSAPIKAGYFVLGVAVGHIGTMLLLFSLGVI